MSTTTEITRITTARNTIRTKFVELGISQSSAKLDQLADAAEAIDNRGAVNAQVREGETYTIPKGYHNGSGVVAGVTGGGNYSLQEKSVTPTKSQQSVTADSGYYGLSGVTVAAIPDNYNDTSAVTASAADVLANKVIVSATGETITGSMTNNGAVNQTLNTTTTSYTVPKGYHNGTGEVTITLEQKDVTPTKATQTIVPSTGKVLSKVTVAPIPAEYQDVTDVTATADKVLTGSDFVDVDGEVVAGTMPNNGAVTKTLDTTTTSYEVPAGYHNGSGKVSIVTETKSATPTKSAQNITPTAGKVLSKVTVTAIPAEYQDVTGVTATAADTLDGKYIVLPNGSKVEGTIPVNGGIEKTIDGLTATSVTIPAGYTTGGSVSLTSDIEDALAAI